MRSVSIEAPEAYILGGQLQNRLRGLAIKDLRIEDVDRLQRHGFVNEDITAFDSLIDKALLEVRTRGAGIILDFDGGVHLVIAPEYGGRVRLFAPDQVAGQKAHLVADFGVTTLMVRLTGMGGLQAWRTDDLDRSFSYQRDFVRGLDPLELDHDEFLGLLAKRKEQLKRVIVGKDAITVGLGNASFQDIMFRSRIYPTRRADALTPDDRERVYEAIVDLMDERLSLDGKEGFEDAFGRPGQYPAQVASGMAGRPCPACTAPIEKIKHGGGEVAFCPKCQT